MRRLISLVLSVALVVTSLHTGWLYASPSPSQLVLPPINSQALLKAVGDFQVPEAIGSLEASYRGKREEVVVLIEDAHAIPDAQKNIQKLIDFFQTQYGVPLVMLEGASTPIDAQIFKSFPDKKLLAEVFNDYFEQGELTGGNAAALFNNSSGVYHGIEDWKLYETGLTHYLEATESESQFAGRLEGLRQDLNQTKERVYSKELLELDQALEQFESGRLDLLTIMRKLSKIQAPEAGTELAFIDEALQELDRKNLSVEIEVRKLANAVRDAIRSRDVILSAAKDLRRVQVEFNQNYQAFQTSQLSPEAFGLVLEEVASELEIVPPLSKELKVLIRYHKQLQEIKGSQLFRDLKRYARQVKSSLISTEDERTLMAFSHRLALTRKLAGLELSRDEWQEVKDILNHANGWDVVPDIMNGKTDLARLITDMKSHTDFYAVAELRDASFFKNTLAQMKKNKTTASIVVSGGFHSDGLMAQLQARKMSYLRITPRMDSIPKETNYHDHMHGKVSWQDYFEVKNGTINLHDAFVRGTRDKLFEKASQLSLRGGVQPTPGLPAGRKQSQGWLLKKWRDQILLDLAKNSNLDHARKYTRFIDETQKVPPDSWRKRISDKAERFISGIRNLNTSGQLNALNVRSLLDSLSSSAFTAGALSGNLLTYDKRYPVHVELRNIIEQPADSIEARLSPYATDQAKGVRAEVRSKVPPIREVLAEISVDWKRLSDPHTSEKKKAVLAALSKTLSPTMEAVLALYELFEALKGRVNWSEKLGQELNTKLMGNLNFLATLMHAEQPKKPVAKDRGTRTYAEQAAKDDVGRVEDQLRQEFSELIMKHNITGILERLEEILSPRSEVRSSTRSERAFLDQFSGRNLSSADYREILSNGSLDTDAIFEFPTFDGTHDDEPPAVKRYNFRGDTTYDVDQETAVILEKVQNSEVLVTVGCASCFAFGYASKRADRQGVNLALAHQSFPPEQAGSVRVLNRKKPETSQDSDIFNEAKKENNPLLLLDASRAWYMKNVARYMGQSNYRALVITRPKDHDANWTLSLDGLGMTYDHTFYDSNHVFRDVESALRVGLTLDQLETYFAQHTKDGIVAILDLNDLISARPEVRRTPVKSSTVLSANQGKSVAELRLPDRQAGNLEEEPRAEVQMNTDKGPVTILEVSPGTNLFDIVANSVPSIINQRMFVVVNEWLQDMKEENSPPQTLWAVFDRQGRLIGARMIRQQSAENFYGQTKQEYAVGVTAIVESFQNQKIGRELVRLSFEHLRNLRDRRIRYYEAGIDLDNIISFRSLHRAATRVGGVVGLVSDSDPRKGIYLVDLFPEAADFEGQLPLNIKNLTLLPPDTDQAWKQVQSLARAEVRSAPKEIAEHLVVGELDQVSDAAVRGVVEAGPDFEARFRAEVHDALDRAEIARTKRAWHSFQAIQDVQDQPLLIRNRVTHAEVRKMENPEKEAREMLMTSYELAALTGFVTEFEVPDEFFDRALTQIDQNKFDQVSVTPTADGFLVHGKGSDHYDLAPAVTVAFAPSYNEGRFLVRDQYGNEQEVFFPAGGSVAAKFQTAGYLLAAPLSEETTNMLEQYEDFWYRVLDEDTLVLMDFIRAAIEDAAKTQTLASRAA